MALFCECQEQAVCVSTALVGGRAHGVLVQPNSISQAGSGAAGAGLRSSLLVMQFQARGALNLPLEGKCPDYISSNEQRNVSMPRSCLENPLRAS